ncbi:MAG: hypothetical protein KIT87_24865, partial [Anaerolineae bacterium]|nr:hypothetical protein [Anaerolineae bacterium]
WPLPDLLTLFWDDFFKKDKTSVYEPGGADDTDYTRYSALESWLKPGLGTDLPRLLILSHGEVSGQEKKGYTPDGKYAEANQVGTAFDRLRQATAFGYEPAAALQWAEWAAWRAEVLAQVPSVWNNPVSGRADFVRLARERLRVGLGDTKRPINEISLWDYASAIAALFKAGVAGAMLDGGIPTPSDMRWRFLTLRLDGSEFLFQANQVADLVARRAALSRAYDAMQRALEVTLPLGNAVYRDEDGLLMVVPQLKNLDDDLYKAELEAHVRQALADQDEADRAAGAYVAVSDALPVVTLGEPLRGKKLLPGACLGPASQAMVEPARMADWWHATGEVCSVCGLRPQGYMEPGLPRYVNASKARERRVCGVCLARRGRRSQVWTEARRDETIWLDEVADHRGQVALVVGRFDLDAWLDGTLIRSLSIGKANDGAQLAKPPTFARIQRVWRTTQDFWETTQVHLAGLLKDDRRRLVIHPRRDLDLGAYHVYDLDLGPTRMSVVWQPGQNRPGCLISADNLGRVARQMGLEAGIYTSPAASAIAVEDWLNRPAEGGWRVFNPDAANTPVGAIPIERIAVEEDAYATVIPILAEPRTFMALVPANRALDVAQVIRQKYEREMGKVRNRLPLHLGLVFADARQPLRALLDAGRRMLAYPGRPTDERWRVAAVATDGDDCVVRLEEIDASPPPASGGSRRGVTWRAPLKMGDGTKDEWYPYVFVATDGDDRTGPGRARQFQAPRPGASEPTWLVHVGDLKQDDEVYFTPATLDIQWLDAAARRFEVAYDDAGRRLTLPRRPYLLDDLPRFQALADALGAGLPAASQRHALRDAIEGKRAAWQPQGEELQGGGAFWQFCRDALATADWHGTPPNLDDWADHAARGTLTDILELYERLDLFKQPGAAASSKGAKEENHA